MKRFLSLFCSLILTGALLTAAALEARAYTPGDPFSCDLSALIENPGRRRYVEMMTDYYIRNDASVANTLAEGLCAVFLFEGCSDNLDDAILSDLSYFRVSAVCLVIRLNEAGEPHIIYFNQNCSTIPDRPLEYGAWSLEKIGLVGPATIRDGTYELYSVKHMGAYEALHIRDSETDGDIPAVYMTPEGYTTADANSINIHTRTTNHTAGQGMWSAGCMLVGDGDFGQFSELMDSAYYSVYNHFAVGQRVGTITVDRRSMARKLYSLYESREAVDAILERSLALAPENYLSECVVEESYPGSRQMRTVRATDLMTLPCSNATDARSLCVETVPRGTRLEVARGIQNSRGAVWYEIRYGLESCFVYGGDAEDVSLMTRFLDFLSG